MQNYNLKNNDKFYLSKKLFVVFLTVLTFFGLAFLPRITSAQTATQLPTPTGLAANCSGSTVNLSWNAVPNATHYIIRINRIDGPAPDWNPGNFGDLSGTGDRTALIQGTSVSVSVDISKNYHYTVQADSTDQTHFTASDQGAGLQFSCTQGGSTTGTAALLTGNIMTAWNHTRGSTAWSDPVDAEPGNVIEFRVVAANTAPGTTANNVVVKASLPTTRTSTLVASTTVSADGIGSATDTATVNMLGGMLEGFEYVPGHTILFNTSCPNGCPMADTILTSGVSVGNLAFNDSAQVTFKAFVTNIVSPTSSPSLTPTTSPVPTLSPTPTVTPTGTITPTATPTGTLTPTVTPTGTITPTLSPTMTVTPTLVPQGGTVSCPSGTVSTVSGSNIICINVQQSQSQTATGGSGGSATVTLTNNVSAASVVTTATPTNTPTGTITPTPGSTTTSTTTTTSTVSNVTELPRTGLPLAAWALSGLLPIGAGLKRFGRNRSDIKDDPQYIWQKRHFDKTE